MTSSCRPDRSADSSSTGTVHQYVPSDSAGITVTVRFSGLRAEVDGDAAGMPMTSASTTPRQASRDRPSRVDPEARQVRGACGSRAGSRPAATGARSKTSVEQLVDEVEDLAVVQPRVDGVVCWDSALRLGGGVDELRRSRRSRTGRATARARSRSPTRGDGRERWRERPVLEDVDKPDPLTKSMLRGLSARRSSASMRPRDSGIRARICLFTRRSCT